MCKETPKNYLKQDKEDLIRQTLNPEIAQNLARFFALLFEIDKRNCPEKYKCSENQDIRQNNTC